VLSPTSRQFAANLVAPQTPSTIYFQVIAQTFNVGANRNGLFVSPSTTRGESLGQITVTTAASGLLVSLSSASPTDEYIVAVDGGAYGTVPQVASKTGQGMTSGTLTVSVPAGGPYRVRAVAVQPGSAASDPIMHASGKAENVTVTAGSFTNVSIALAPITIATTAPSSVTAGAPYQVSWTYTDPGSALDRASTAEARFSSGSAPFTDLAGPCCNVLVLGTVLSPTSRQFTANLVAPQTPGTSYFQVIAQTFNVGTNRNGWYVNPSTIRGEALGQISVTPGTGVRLTLSAPTSTNEFIVAVDGGAFGSTPQVSHLTGSSMTSGSLILGVPAGGPYRVRAIAVDPRSANATFPIMNASGKADNVTVSTGSLTDVSITLAPMSVTVTAPSTVTAGSQVQISWTYTDPGAALDRTPTALDGRVFYSTTPMTQDLTGTQLYATGTALSPTSYQFTVTFTAPLTSGTLYFQVTAQTFDLSIPGTSRAGWYMDPSLSRGESLRQITVQ